MIRSTRRWWAAAAVALVLLASACAEERATKTDDTLPALSATTVAPTTTLPCGDAPLAPGSSLSATAVPEGDIEIREAPDPAAPVVRTLPNPRLINGDPSAAVPLVFLVTDTPDAACDWVEVMLPVRPNGSTGFVRRSEVTLTPNPFRIEVHLEQYRLVVFQDDQPILDTKIGRATDATPTPPGLYYVTELVKTPNPGGAYGPYAYGLSGFSEVLETFNGGPGQLAIHGTNQPQLIGQKVSHGCIRIHNDEITRLAGILPLGVPVTVFA
jgi:lipoprotein-anchoring transpeptidase ErfK/SrfK